MNKKSKNYCSACGTSQINHQLLFISNFLEETIGKFFDKFFNFETKKEQKFVSLFEKLLFSILSIIKIIKYNDDVERALTGRSKIIWEEAKRRNIKMQQMLIFGKPVELYKALIKNETIYFQSIPIPPTFPQNGQGWVDDKLNLFKKLKEHKIHVPNTKKITSFKNGEIIFNEFQKPLIIKPQYGSRGRHTTTNINTFEEFKEAFNLVRQITPCIIVQEHLFGKVYRATVINNKLVGFFQADFPKIIGDGKKTILELIQEQNKTHNIKVSEIIINDDLINFLKRQKYTLENIPKEKTMIHLSGKTGRMYGGHTKEMINEIHPKIHKIFKKAGNIVNITVAGFDLIMEDPTKDPDTQKWGIIECNSLPFIDLHYFALEGPKINLAKNIWNLWE